MSSKIKGMTRFPKMQYAHSKKDSTSDHLLVEDTTTRTKLNKYTPHQGKKEMTKREKALP